MVWEILQVMCNNIIDKFENVIYVKIIDKNAKLLVEKDKNFEDDMIIEGITSQSYLPNTYEIYNVLRNMDNKLSHLKSDNFSYIVIKKNKFKLIVMPLFPNKTK